MHVQVHRPAEPLNERLAISLSIQGDQLPQWLIVRIQVTDREQIEGAVRLEMNIRYHARQLEEVFGFSRGI